MWMLMFDVGSREGHFMYKSFLFSIWVFPKIVVPPKSSILIGFSIIFTIHFEGFSHPYLALFLVQHPYVAVVVIS